MRNNTKFKKGMTPWNKGNHNPTKPNFSCVACGKQFYRRPCHFGTTVKRCCSWACRTKIMKQENKFENIKKYLIKKGEHRGKKTIFKKGDSRVSGPNNSNWKGGITPKNKILRKSSEWKNWRKSVFEKDNYVCQSCGVNNDKLEPHHLFSFKDNPEYIFEVWNGQTLCRECHVHLHNELGWR